LSREHEGGYGARPSGVTEFDAAIGAGGTPLSLRGRAWAWARASTDRRAAPAVVVSLVSAVYVWTGLDRRWYPWDEGALAQPAARILDGQLPHRDFDDAYTGGLSYLHAAAFEVFGRELTSLRLVLFAFFVAWVPVLVYVASRYLRPVEAGAVALVAVVWSVPNYPASMPSWYCTFLATFGAAALLRHLETERRRWLFVAGICGGLSVTVKIVGVYFIAAALMYLVFKTNSDVRKDASPGRSSSWYSLFVVSGGVALTMFVVLLLGSHVDASTFVNFVVPVVSLALFTCWSLRLRAGRSSSADLRSLFALTTPFLAGVALPVGAFIAPYLATGAVGDLASGVWPTRRLDNAVSPPTLWTLIALVPVAVVVLLARDIAKRGAREKALAAILATGLASAALIGSHASFAYVMTWHSMRAIVPALSIVGLAIVARRLRSNRDPIGAQQVVLLLEVMAMCSLVQFPYPASIYFAYVAPLVFLAAAAVWVYAACAWRPILWTFIAFYLIFGVVRLNGNSLKTIGRTYQPAGDTYTLRMPRGGLAVGRTDATMYDRIVALVDRHDGGSRYIYAAPDSPEVYFLTDHRNPTKTLFEYLDTRPTAASQLISVLGAHHVNVVVVNLRPPVSAPLDAELRHALDRYYPHSSIIFGHFVVRWHT
jgi:hypothetical protein